MASLKLMAGVARRMVIASARTIAAEIGDSRTVMRDRKVRGEEP
jgi:hypothetical protein